MITTLKELNKILSKFITKDEAVDTLKSSFFSEFASPEQGIKADTAVQKITIDGVEQTKTDTTVNLPAYPTTLPANDVYNWAKQPTKPTYTAEEIGALSASDGAIPTKLSDLADDETHRTVTDTEKNTWNSKGNYTKPDDGIPSTDLNDDLQQLLANAKYIVNNPGSTGGSDGAIGDYVEAIKMNNVELSPTNGVVDLGTVITSHQDISGKIDKTQINATNGVAGLNEYGMISSDLIDVDEIQQIIFYNGSDDFPLVGDKTKLYFDKSKHSFYEWVESTDESGETVGEYQETTNETITLKIEGLKNDVSEATAKVTNHIADKTVHITSDERTKWNSMGDQVTYSLSGTTLTITTKTS